MPESPIPLTATNFEELKHQLQTIIDDLYQEKVAGAEVGDVFSIDRNSNVLTVDLVEDGGIIKVEDEELAVDPDMRGDVHGPDASTDNAIARFHLATGKIIQNSAVIMNDDGDITVPDDNWIGLGAAKARIKFEEDVPNVISFLGCEVEIGNYITLDDNGSIIMEGAFSKQPRLTIENRHDDAHASQINFWKLPDTLSDDDQLGYIGAFCIRTAQPITYIDFRIADESNDHTGGEINFGCKMDDVAKYMLRLKGYNGAVGEGEVIVNDSAADIDFIVKKNTAGIAYMYDAGDDDHCFGDGGTTNYAKFAGDGELTLHGTARVGSDIYVSPSGIKAPLIKPATWVDHGISGAWQFADADDKTLVLNYRIPHRMDRSVAPKFHIKWSTAGAAAGNCEWQVEYRYLSPNESTILNAQDTENIIVAASAIANGTVSSDTLGLDLPSATDILLQVRLKRLAAGGNDTIAGTVELHGINFHSTSNKFGEAT